MTDIVEGKIPKDINGVYLKIGPNAKFLPKNNRVHWFDGDGMIHSVRIQNGTMIYCNRFV
jgi:carotenoid cleavage dioxygenase-like enzyme